MDPRLRSTVLLFIIILASACYVRVRKVEVDEVLDRMTAIRSPVKVHLLDGSVVVFPNGAFVTNDSVRGAGERFSVLQQSLGDVDAVALDSTLGITHFSNRTKVGQSVVLSLVGTAAAAGLGMAAAVAIFGSCPTFYTDSSGTAVLQAEGFSYSIARLFESRDHDALRGTPQHGVYTIEMRNEALETHYVNHLELLVYEHAPDARALPDGRGAVTVVRSLAPPLHARDRTGRDVQTALHTIDDVAYDTPDSRMRALRSDDLMDHIDLSFGVMQEDSVAIVMRLRNSLLTTVLFYDVMLADAGAEAIDWVAQDLEQIGAAADIGRWYVERMGLRVLVQQGDAYVEAGRIPDAGPIAWKDVALLIPARRGVALNVRLEFPADSWRIDQVALAHHAERVVPVAVAPARVRHGDNSVDARALAAIAEPDDAYLITEPGRHVFIDFDVAPAKSGRVQSFLLASQGYYNEWIRPDWIRAGGNTRFSANDVSLFNAMQRWQQQRAQLEQRFYTSRIATQ